VNILERLWDVRLTYGLYPVLPADKALNGEEIAADPRAAFTAEDPGDRMSLTTDRASNMKAAAEAAGAFDWNPCICHILHTAVTYAMEQSGLMTEYIEPLRALSKKVRKSPSIWQSFRKLQQAALDGEDFPVHADAEDYSDSGGESDHDDVAGLPEGVAQPLVDPDDTNEQARPNRILRLGSWCKTRWNSTYWLMKRAVCLEKSIRALLATQETGVVIPTGAWAAFKNVIPCLDSIRELAERCEGDTYITISEVLHNVLKLLYSRTTYDPAEASERQYKVAFIKHFKAKMLETLDDVNLLYGWALAAACDGRRSGLQWMWRIWEPANKDDWKKVTTAYKTLSRWKGMIREHMTTLVSRVMDVCTLYSQCSTECCLHRRVRHNASHLWDSPCFVRCSPAKCTYEHWVPQVGVPNAHRCICLEGTIYGTC